MLELLSPDEKIEKNYNLCGRNGKPFGYCYFISLLLEFEHS